MSELEHQLHSWMSLALQGDAQAYHNVLEALAIRLREYLGRLWNARRARSPEQVEDLVQDVLLIIHRKRHLYDPARPFLPWVYTLTRHRLIDQMRESGRQVETTAWIEDFDQVAFVSFEEIFSAKDQVGFILEGLPDRQREILRLAKIEGLALEEISETLQMSLSNVKVSLHRAIKSIRKKMEDEGVDLRRS